MTAKEYLQQIRRLDFEIKRHEKRITEMRETTYTTGGGNYDNIPSTGMNGSALENKVVKYIDEVKELQKLIYKKNKEKKRIELQIMSLKNTLYAEILIYKYVDCLSWSDVAHITDYSISHLKNMHKKALKAFDNKFHQMLINIKDSTK